MGKGKDSKKKVRRYDDADAWMTAGVIFRHGGGRCDMRGILSDLRGPVPIVRKCSIFGHVDGKCSCNTIGHGSDAPVTPKRGTFVRIFVRDVSVSP